MQIIVNRNEFLKKIRVVEKAISDNKIRPILSCVYMEIKGNEIFLCGTNLKTTISTTLKTKETINEGKVAFHFALLDEYLKELKEEFVTLRLEEGNVLFIETEDSTTEFAIFSAEDYPNNFKNIVLNDENLKFKISSTEFVNILEKLIVSADITMENSPMNCIRIESVYKLLHFISTDTYRLSYFNKNISKDIENFAVSIPTETVSSFIKIIKGLEDCETEIYQEEDHLYIKYQDITIITRLIQERYPNYENILINNKYDKKLLIPVDKFISILKRTLIFSRGNTESKYSATYTFKDEQMKIKAINEIAKIDEKVNVNFTGENLTISLNVKYMLDFLQNIDKSKNVEIEFMNSSSAVKVYEEGTENYIYILMPLALREY